MNKERAIQYLKIAYEQLDEPISVRFVHMAKSHISKALKELED